MSGTLRINGVEVKTPQDFNFAKQTIHSDESGRNANGDMAIDRIADKIKLECKWGPLSDSEAAALLNLMDNTFMQISYPDPQKGQITKTFYVGDRSAAAYSWNAEFEAMKWQGLSANFIQQ